MTRLAGVFALALCCVAAACGGESTPRTQVMVLVDAESKVRSLAVDIELEVRSGTGPVDKWDVRAKRSLTPGAGIEWPLEAALVPREGDADRVYLVAAIARNEAGDAVAEVRAISGYQAGKTVALLLLFEDSCIDKSLSCNDTQTCRRGECVDARVDTKDLPLYTPGQDTDASSASEPDASTDGAVADAGTDAAPKACEGHSDCDDGDPCNGVETCEKNTCERGTAVECDDSGEVCRPNVCVNEKGKAVCKLRDAKDGTACRDGDESTKPEASCATDYECAAGECIPQTVEDCEPTQCENAAGCDPQDGCVFEPLDDTTACDDDDLCTEGDHCSGTDGTCVGTAKDCSDGVSCTVDTCDAGACVHTPDDALCGGPCKTGTCDMTMDCLNPTFAEDFGACDDGKGATSPDLCYRGECLGGRQGAPAGSCELGGCQCSSFGAVRDLQYSATGTKFVGLLETNQSGGGGSCTTGTVSNVYDVTRTMLTPYTSADTAYGGIAENSTDLDLSYVISSAHVGVANVTGQSVDWLDGNYSAAIAAQTPALAGFRSSARHSTGSIAGTLTSHFWLVGRDSSTSTTARIVRCQQCSSVLVGGCADTSLTCSYVTSAASSTFVAVQPYTSGGVTTTYGGTVAAINFSTGAVRKRLLEDGAGKDLVPSTAEADDVDGAWSGLLRLSGTGQVLAYGSGTNNLRVCSDPSNTGDTTCSAVSGLPNQAVRAYHRAAGYSSAVAMLATTSTSNYLVLLPTGLSPSTGANWREVTLANSGTTSATAVAIGPSSFMVLGKSGAAPYVWYWGP